MRLFIGIPLPEEYQEMLASIRQEWDGRLKSKLTWTKHGNWHLTLKFLGEIQEDRLAGLEYFMKNLSFQSFSLQGSGAGFFGSKGMYRVMWLGLGLDVKALIALADKIDQSLAELGFVREQRMFKGHLTLARIRKFVRNDPWNNVAKHISTQAWPVFEVKEVILWQSFPGPRGPRYEVAGRAGLLR